MARLPHGDIGYVAKPSEGLRRMNYGFEVVPSASVHVEAVVAIVRIGVVQNAASVCACRKASPGADTAPFQP